MEKTREESYDLLKGMGILLVLWGHTFCPPTIKNTIYAFHMPLFFFVSGCFFKQLSIRQTLQNKGKRLLLPWITFVIITFMIFTVFDYRTTHTVMQSLSNYNQILIRGICGDEHSLALYKDIWFLFVLFLVFVAYTIIRGIIKSEFFVTALCLVAYGGGYWLCAKNINLPYFIDTVLSVMIYFHIGYCFHNYKIDQKNVGYKWGLALFAAFVAFCLIINPETDLKYNRFEWYMLPLAIMAILSLFYIFKDYKKITEIKIFRFLYRILMAFGIESIILLGLHRHFYYLWPSIYTRLSLPDKVLSVNTEYLIGIAMVVFTAMICLYLAQWFHKLLPKVFGR